VALSFPLLTPAVLAIAASVAASRVVLGLHFLSDVLVGAALGLGIGGMTYLVLL
jgi:undecaprenyl-diphosphatase